VAAVCVIIGGGGAITNEVSAITTIKHNN